MHEKNELKLKIFLGSSFERHRGFHGELLDNPPHGARIHLVPVLYHYFIPKKRHSEKAISFNPFNAFSALELVEFPDGADVIHSVKFPIYNQNIPWVIDFGSISYSLFFGKYSHGIEFRRLIEKKDKRILDNFTSHFNLFSKMLAHPSCRRILVWKRETKEELEKVFYFCPEIISKISLLPPAVHIPNLKIKKNNKVRILFVGREFHGKGGPEVLEVFDRIKSKYDIEMIYIGLIPQKELLKLKNFHNQFIHHNSVSRKILYDFYANADIFLFPSRHEAFGMVVLEALSHGIPVVATNSEDTTSFKKLILHGKNGFLVKKVGEGTREDPVDVEGLSHYISKLIENRNLRRAMSMKARESIKKSNFTIENRNKVLQEIYCDAYNFKKSLSKLLSYKNIWVELSSGRFMESIFDDSLLQTQFHQARKDYEIYFTNSISDTNLLKFNIFIKRKKIKLKFSRK